MRTLRTVTLLLAVMALALGSTVAAAGTDDQGVDPIAAVTGTLGVQRVPGGTFDVADGVFQYRDYALIGPIDSMSDPRLMGELSSDWNWDVHALGDQPKPAWGMMTIAGADGTWEGSFTGIQRADFEPVGIRAFLFGTGPYEGLCATLDITATGLGGSHTWVVDGVVHPAPMAG